jgi:meso-butanediol dehydrogenase / (S,S)-butanediol dehydrogenase / diacetyl reductase
MAGRLAGKVALITGTADGQGRAAAELFAAQGARVVGCDVKTALAEETVARVRAAGGEMVSMHPLDLADEAQVQAWTDFAVASYGDFDILYNNASAVRGGTIEGLSRADWDWNLANEVTLIFLAVKHAIPVFRRKGSGVVLNIGSVAGMIGAAMPGNAPGNFVHNVSKGAVIRMTTHMAVELAPLNVRVNCISPGIIDTPATRPLLGGGMREAFLDANLIRRAGQPEDIARAALFLCSEEAGFITGVNLPVDGGWSAGGGVGQPDVRLAQAIVEKMGAYHSNAR